METDKINNVEAIFLIIIVMLTHIILSLPNSILISTGPAAVINTLYVSILVIIFFLIINKLFSPFENKDIIDVSEFVGGKPLKILTSILYCGYLIFISSILLLNFSENLQIIYYPNAKIWSIILIFIIVAVIVNKLGFKNVVKSNALIIPLILVSIIIIFCASFSELEPEKMLPLIGYGFSETFIKGSSNVFAFGGLIYLFLIRPNLKNSKDYKKIGIISIIISALYLILSVASLLLQFPFIQTGTEVLSAYLTCRNIEFGKFFERTDALFIFIWILAFISYISVIIAYIVKVNKKNISIKNPSILIYLIAILIFIITLIPQNIVQITFLKNVIYKYLAIGIVFAYSFIILLIGYIKKSSIVKLKKNSI